MEPTTKSENLWRKMNSAQGVVAIDVVIRAAVKFLASLRVANVHIGLHAFLMAFQFLQMETDTRLAMTTPSLASSSSPGPCGSSRPAKGPGINHSGSAYFLH